MSSYTDQEIKEMGDAILNAPSSIPSWLRQGQLDTHKLKRAWTLDELNNYRWCSEYGKEISLGNHKPIDFRSDLAVFVSRALRYTIVGWFETQSRNSDTLFSYCVRANSEMKSLGRSDLSFSEINATFTVAAMFLARLAITDLSTITHVLETVRYNSTNSPISILLFVLLATDKTVYVVNPYDRISEFEDSLDYLILRTMFSEQSLVLLGVDRNRDYSPYFVSYARDGSQWWWGARHARLHRFLAGIEHSHYVTHQNCNRTTCPHFKTCIGPQGTDRKSHINLNNIGDIHVKRIKHTQKNKKESRKSGE